MTRLALPVLALFLALTAGCLPKAKRDRTRYFVLEPVATPPADKLEGKAIGLGPITFPEYLSRSELVERIAPAEIRIHDGEQWAEPLAEGFARALRRQVSHRLGAPVLAYPWDVAAPPAVAVEIQVERFECAPGGVAELFARVVIRDPETNRPLVSRDIQLTERLAKPPAGAPAPVAGAPVDPTAAVDALSRLTTRFAATLGDEIEGLGKGK